MWLGHPLHPVLARVPLGAWLSASFLNAWPRQERASRRLVLAGLAATSPGGAVAVNLMCHGRAGG
jgi:hypothetical protein